MESTRQKKISRLIQKEMALQFQRKELPICNNAIVSITEVKVSADLKYAKLFVSIYPSDQPLEEIKLMNQKQYLIRKKLAEKIKKQVRVIPELRFFLDDSISYSEEIERLLNK
tara:strand:- start:4150 stop:4488 length:339 start_codon:yes stop_codon:yes gene_type:complete